MATAFSLISLSVLSRKLINKKSLAVFFFASTLLFLFFFDTTQAPHRWVSLIRQNMTASTRYIPSPVQLDAVFPPPDPERKDYREWNAQTLRELHSCIALDNCGSNQRKVALLAAHWFEEATVRGWRGGEGVWGMSVYKNLRALGYTTLFATSFAEAQTQYRMMPSLVKVVLRNCPKECHDDPQCVKSPSNPSGIPAWKIFDFEFYPSYGDHQNASLLGGKWILSANPDHRVRPGEPSPIQYIGYSIEDFCTKIPVVPLKERKNQIWLLMKELTYVYGSQFAWNRSYFPLVASDLNITVIGGWEIDESFKQEDRIGASTMEDIADPEHGVVNLGRLGQQAFAREVGVSKVMLGVGSPYWSPSPYNALCQGVPFVNPVLTYSENDPWDKSKWYTQHPSLNHIDPPYVYHVHARNYTELVRAIRAASETEIGRFIPEHMTEAALRARLVTLMETDWLGAAKVLLEENERKRKDGVDAYIFEL